MKFEILSSTIGVFTNFYQLSNLYKRYVDLFSKILSDLETLLHMPCHVES